MRKVLSQMFGKILNISLSKKEQTCKKTAWKTCWWSLRSMPSAVTITSSSFCFCSSNTLICTMMLSSSSYLQTKEVMLQVNTGTRAMYEICSKLAIRISGQRHWHFANTCCNMHQEALLEHRKKNLKNCNMVPYSRF